MSSGGIVVREYLSDSVSFCTFFLSIRPCRFDIMLMEPSTLHTVKSNNMDILFEFTVALS